MKGPAVIFPRVARATLVAVCLLIPLAAMASDEEDIKKSQEAIAEFQKADPEMQSFFDDSYGYAVFNSVGKGGIGIGGAHGSGIVYVGGQTNGKTKLTQVTIGLQLGGQAFREIIFFQNKDAFDSFTGGDFELSAQASAVAVTAGAAAGTNFDSGMAVFTMAKGGLMYEATIGGQGFSYEPFEKPGKPGDPEINEN
jgi:lipid-binding SYLF domain-containing protein